MCIADLKAAARSLTIHDGLVLIEIHNEAANTGLSGHMLESGGDTIWKSDACAVQSPKICIKFALKAVQDVATQCNNVLYILYLASSI